MAMGIDRYKDDGIPQLKNAVRDAKGFASFFRENYVVHKVYELYNFVRTHV